KGFPKDVADVAYKTQKKLSCRGSVKRIRTLAKLYSVSLKRYAVSFTRYTVSLRRYTVSFKRYTASLRAILLFALSNQISYVCKLFLVRI
ncbi:MAG: hypothetical protein ACRCX5_13945, partial [Bacteroidales bacterium]